MVTFTGAAAKFGRLNVKDAGTTGRKAVPASSSTGKISGEEGGLTNVGGQLRQL
jgi:hypothetical protein